MPPEPLPWDRSSSRKHDRSVARWRDSHPPPRATNSSSATTTATSTGWDDFRRPPPQGHGHGKQGGYHHLFSDDPASSASRVKYNTRNTKPSFLPTHKDTKNGSYLWDSGDSSSARQQQQQQHDPDLLTYASQPQSDFDNSSSDLHPFPRYDKDQSLGPIGWKPLKWNRSTSFSSRGSAFSHTSSSRTIGADSEETRPDLQSGRLTPTQSPSTDAAAAVGATSNAPFEDTCPRKKQRLGWGQGLAKYEKQKVEGSDETINKTGLLPCASGGKPSQTIPTLPDKTPGVAGLSECASPLTTTSVACSSSPGIDDKSHMKASNNDMDTCNLSSSPAHGFQSCLEEFSANLEDLSSATNLSDLLSDLLQQEDASSGDSNFVKSTAMNKLLLVKSELSKALEKTECEIDLFENELKTLNSEFGSNGSHSVASLQGDYTLRPCENVGTLNKAFQKPSPLLLVSSSDMQVDMPDLSHEALEGVIEEVKDDDVDSPGTATSKFVDPLSMEGVVSAYSMGKHDECSLDAVAAGPAFSEQQWFSDSANEENSASLSGGDDRKQQSERSVSTQALGDLNPECSLNDLILVSNRESARKAFEVFDKVLPAVQSEVDLWGTCNISCQKKNALVKRKVALRKCFQRFKERVLALKFRALQHLWKEDMRLLSIRKYKVKSQKRIESNTRASQVVYQKHRSSIRSRFMSPAGSLTLVPTSEILDFTSKLLSDTQIKLWRDSLKMPALLDEKEKRMSRFVSSNGLVEDPCAAEKERVLVNPWTPMEKEIFLEKLATFGKNFKRIASYLDHKTIADCVEFYYKNHKSESFEKIKKSELKKQERGVPTNTYLMLSAEKWNREVNAASLDLLGEASVIAAHADVGLKSQHTYASRSFQGGHYYKTCWGDDASYEKSSSVDILGNEREATAADTLAGICGAISSEAVSSCVTSSVDPGESCQEGKFQKNSVMDQPLTPKFVQSIDDEETCSDDSCEDMDAVDWTDDEKSNFIGALRSYGKDFMKVSRCVRSKSREQCKVFFSKARKSLGLDVIYLGTGREGTPFSDANGERSDSEDACVLEMESAICSNQSCSKLEMDCMFSVNREASDHAATNPLEFDKVDRLNETIVAEQLNDMQTDEPERSGENNEIDLLNHDGAAVERSSIIENCEPNYKPELVISGEDSSIVEEKLDGSPKVMYPESVLKTDTSLICDLPAIVNVDVGFSQSPEGVVQQETITSVKESVITEEAGGHYLPSDGVEEKKAKLAAPAGILKAESGPQQEMAEHRDGGIQSMRTGVDSNYTSASGLLELDSNMIQNSSYMASDASIPQCFGLAQTHQPLITLQSVQKPHMISWEQKENTPVSAANSLLPGSLIQYEGHLRRGSSSSTLNFEGTRNEQHQHQKPASADVYQRYLFCHQSLNQAESPQILRGYPLQVLSKKGINGHADCTSCEKQSIIHKSSVTGNFLPAQFIVQDFHREHCNGPKLPRSLPELPLLVQNNEQLSLHHTRSHSQGSSDAEDSRRGGDVKLFGQILTHPSTSQKPSLGELDSKGPTLLPKSSCRTFDLKFTDQGTERALMTSKLDADDYSGSDDFPARSYGFWDGSRIQTGLTSLPDSSVLLAKYPATFSDYSVGSSCGDQHSLPAVSKWSDRSSSSVSIYPAKVMGSSNSSLGDCHVYRGGGSGCYDGAKVQPFTVDIKRHETVCELQRRNGSSEISSFQKQLRGGGAGGGDVMGAGILVGGGCTGVSDPVAAIKMHYATSERYVGKSGSSRRDEESWRGDMGR